MADSDPLLQDRALIPFPSTGKFLVKIRLDCFSGIVLGWHTSFLRLDNVLHTELPRTFRESKELCLEEADKGGDTSMNIWVFLFC